MGDFGDAKSTDFLYAIGNALFEATTIMWY